GRISSLTKIVEDLDRLESEKQAALEAQRKAEAEARARQTDTAPPREPPPSHPVPAAAWITAIAGGAGLLAGGVFGIVAVSRHNAAVADTNSVTATASQNDALTFAQATN